MEARGKRSPPTLVLLERLSAGIERVGTWMGDLAGWSYLLCAFFITFDVLSRRFLGFSSQGTTEITGYALAFGITWGLAHALTTKGHIRVDVMVMRTPLRVRAYLHVLALAFLTVFGFLLTRRAWDVVLESWDFGARDVTPLKIPLVIPQALWAVGLTVFALLAVVMLLRTGLLLALLRNETVDQLLRSRSADEETEETLEAVGVDSTSPTAQRLSAAEAPEIEQRVNP